MKEADRLRSHHGSRYVRMLCIELAYSFIKLVRTVDNKTVLLALGSLAYSDQRTLGYDMFILINLKNIIISLFQTVDCNYRLAYNQIPVNDFTFVDRRLDMMVGSLSAVSAGFFSFSTFRINFSLHLTRCLLFTLWIYFVQFCFFLFFFFIVSSTFVQFSLWPAHATKLIGNFTI